MAANGISTLGTKALKQVAKLDIAQLKRRGYTLYADGTTNFGSAQFSGSNYLSVTNAAFIFTGDFTVEGWYYPTNVTGSHSLFCLGPDPANRYVFALSGTSVSSNLYGFGLTTYTSTVPINTWTHIAVVRSGSTVKVYINGTASVTTDTQAGTIGNGTLNIGADAANGALFVGNISNFRVVKGTALYTATFTPSLSPFKAIDGTQLLLNTDNGANFLKDSSTNNFTVTNTGSVVTSSLGPGPDTNTAFYRARNTYDITQLPTQYTGNAVTNNANTGGLVVGRPWTSVNVDTAITVIETSETGATLILNLDSRNTNSLARGASPGTWYDLTDNNNDATIYGSVAYGTVGGQSCAVFPGGDANYAKCVPNVYFDGNSFTIQSWVYVSAVLNWNRIIDFGNGAGSNNILLSNTYGGSGKPGIYIEGTEFQSTYPGSSTVLLNAWHQICATFTRNTSGNTNQGVARIYIDGQQYGSGTTSIPVNITRTLCYIGKSNWGNPPDPNMQGGIGAIQIYNGALTAAEMLSNYNTTKSYYGL